MDQRYKRGLTSIECLQYILGILRPSKIQGLCSISKYKIGLCPFYNLAIINVKDCPTETAEFPSYEYRCVKYLRDWVNPVYKPCVVTEEFEILDGHHRIQLARENKVPQILAYVGSSQLEQGSILLEEIHHINAIEKQVLSSELPKKQVSVKKTNSKDIWHVLQHQYQDTDRQMREIFEKSSFLRLALMEEPASFAVIPNVIEEVLQFVVMLDGLLLSEIRNPSNQVCDIAINCDGRAIKYVKGATKSQRKRALQQNGNAYFYLHQPTPQEWDIAIKTTPTLKAVLL